MKLIKATIEMDIRFVIDNDEKFKEEILLEQLKREIGFTKDIKIIKSEEINDFIIDADIISEKEL